MCVIYEYTNCKTSRFVLFSKLFNKRFCVIKNSYFTKLIIKINIICSLFELIRVTVDIKNIILLYIIYNIKNIIPTNDNDI